MKKIIAVIVLTGMLGCAENKQKTEAVRTEIICGDSIEIEMFDESGNPYTVKMPGYCDTVLVTEE